MSWEESKALTPIKRDFLTAFFERVPNFFLTGGSALGIFYLQHRLSYDLDFFTTAGDVQWHILDNEVRDISNGIGAVCESLTASPTFRRYELSRGDEREILDFVAEQVPQIDEQKERFGPISVDTLREIMVNKICTLIGRCEIKDLVDLYFMNMRGLRVRDHIEDARMKEGGLDPAMIAYLLDRVRIDHIPDYVLEPIDADDLRIFIADLQRELADLSFPED